MNGRELWRQGRNRLSPHLTEYEAAQEARWLLKAVCADMFSASIGQSDVLLYGELIDKRLAGEPLAYILGETQFMGLPFTVNEKVLIPRGDSESVVEKAIALLPRREACRVADIGTGSGAYGLSIAYYCPGAQVDAVDISGEAITVARRNACLLKLADRLRFGVGDLCAPLSGQYRLIVSNPPYIAASEMPGLSPEVLREPRAALTDNGDGLSFYRRLATETIAYMAPGGFLLVEIGCTQLEAVKDLLARAAWRELEWGLDGGGRPRWVLGRR